MRLLTKSCCRLLLVLSGALAAGAWAAQAPAPDAGESAKTLSREEVTGIIAQSRRIVSPHGIEELRKVRIGGIDQWLSIRGHDRRNPILLVLHGGPASPSMPIGYTYQTPWEDYFTVVQWDQRGTGKTYAANSEAQMAPGMTIEGMTEDGAQVVQYLRQRYDKQKIFLLGHSWGTVLGVNLAQRHPDWFYAYIGVGQVVNVRKNEELGYAFALQQARAHDNAEAIAALEGIAPYPGDEPMTIERIAVRSRWETYYGGLAFGRDSFAFDADAESLSPDYSQRDLDAIGKGSMFSLRHLLQPLLKVDFDHTTRFGCPVLLFVGAHDQTTSHVLAEQWFDDLQAPWKHLVVFADSAHMVMQEQPGRFLVHLLTDALPLAQRAGDAAPGETTR
ncbi:alpha/beta fold hydrolase [Frateuria sp. STR12]|uniref:alpha/beta fold hydrolase n=1 Tax=Frateuria hangzhouensis TaxID=2995589 RepID=UPI002260CC33|nr:alpha/beta hydrolase [Frateuria sp. STR12]MCX7513669.1 alpha/beta hydrolase [Frateuria sp. STR12]